MRGERHFADSARHLSSKTPTFLRIFALSRRQNSNLFLSVMLRQFNHVRALTAVRLFSTKTSLFRQAVYDYAKISSLVSKSASSSSSSQLIDVREPHEYEAGNIPTSRNLPLSNLERVLALKDAEFEQTTGFKKPKKDEELIFYCKAGVRSTNASGIAEKLGWNEIGNYKGSWIDWTAQQSESTSTEIKNPNVQSGVGQGAAGGIDLKAMNQKEEARAQDTKASEGGKPLSGHSQKESESVRSGAELSGNKKFQ